ncbi:PREDICTED: protein insensitive-like [Nicrophorus vespilloides]|uniref:Protein insensitive-like n=1 Tax=Nicrophorus vespilloides TaxID=110193 RepID=A0ABM1M8E9_NICVS|nr:PREDICTED: protein insensitive-like [Nicrophorus vespilloides]
MSIRRSSRTKKSNAKSKNAVVNVGASTTSRKRKRRMDDKNELIRFGPNKTALKAGVLDSLNWSSIDTATRGMLMILFKRETLASHSLSGKMSNAFVNDKLIDMKARPQLDPFKIEDMVYLMCKTFDVHKSRVHKVITRKCGTEHHLRKAKMEKLKKNYDSS